MYLGKVQLRDSDWVLPTCQAPLPGPENTVVKGVGGLPSGENTSALVPSGTRANLLKGTKERVTNMTRGQEGFTEVTLSGRG